MILSGFTDEVSADLDKQIEACRHLGWDTIDLRTVGDKNICHLTEAEMDGVLESLDLAGLKPLCFGSPIANWSRPLTYSLEDEIKELEHAAVLMHKCNVKGIRIMSYKTDDLLSADDPFGGQIASRLKELVTVAEHQGITLLHENCDTWGGQSMEHTKFLLDQISSPSFRLIFDTGNPPGSKDVRGSEPYRYQKGLDFLKQVVDFVDVVHIKDARHEGDELEYCSPAKGEGQIPEILSFLKNRGYDGPFSIEPHMAVVFHDDSVKADDKKRWDTFISYANDTQALLKQAGY